jgi:hypothetical protein
MKAKNKPSQAYLSKVGKKSQKKINNEIKIVKSVSKKK